MHAPEVPSLPHTAPAGYKHALGFTLAAAFLGWMFDGLEMGIFPLVARPALQEFAGVGGTTTDAFVQHWMGIITATFLFGAALGGLVFGWLGDRIGRVRAMIFSVLAYSLFTGANYFAQSPIQLATFRFIAAIGMGGEWSLGVALVMEAWPRDKRSLMAGLIGAAANVGYAAIAVLAVFIHVTTDSWRWVMLVGAGPALLTLLIAKFVPESERWHESVAKEGVVANPLAEIFGPALRKNTILAILFASVALIVTWGIVQWIPAWVDSMKGTVPTAKAYSQLWSSIGAIVGCLLAPLVGARFGRRPVYFGLCLLALITCSILFNFFDSYSVTLLFMIFLVGTFASAFYGWLPQYLPELFPTRIRATGQGIAFNSGRILAGIGAWNMGSIMSFFGHSYSKAGAALVFVYLIGMILIWFAPETRGKPLPD